MKTRNVRRHLVGLALVTATSLRAFASDEPLPGSQAGNTSPPASPAPITLNPPSSPIAAQKQPAERALSVWSAQILKLSQSGVDDGIIFSYIDSAGTFNLNAQQIVTLTQGGISRDVLTAMIQHDADIISGVKQVLPSTVPASDTPLFLPPPPQARLVAVAKKPAQPTYEGEAPQPEFAWEPIEEPYDPPEVEERSPVRKPYAVRLTDTILVFRMEGRMPNTTLLHSLP